jgi:hypothetical protein
MGAMQALEWGIHYPEFMDGLLLIVPASRSDRHVRAIFDAVEVAIKLDHKYQNGAYTEQPREGIILGGMIYFPWLYSDEQLATITDESAWDKASRAFGTAWANAWDANSLLSRYHAASRFDPSTPFGGDMGKALAQVKARTLIMRGMTDRTLPTYLARELYRGIKNASCVEIPELSRTPRRRPEQRGYRRVRLRDGAHQGFPRPAAAAPVRQRRAKAGTAAPAERPVTPRPRAAKWRSRRSHGSIARRFGSASLSWVRDGSWPQAGGRAL